MNLASEQLSILDHTINRAAGCRYCGGGKEMDELVSAGLMEYIGTPCWSADPFYTITSAGRNAWKEWSAAQPKLEPPKSMSKSKERYRRYLQCGDMFPSFLDFCRHDAKHS